MTSMCEVKNCLLVNEPLSKRCAIHRMADLAKSIGVTKSKCADCQRAIRDGDWIWRKPVTAMSKAKATRFIYRHVACEPPSARPSKKALRESVKPLLTLTLLAMFAAGCSTPTAPTTQKPSVLAPGAATLTVQVFDRATDTPLAGASVCGDKACLTTGTTGTVALSLTHLEVPVRVYVYATGYRQFSYMDKLTGSERWSFWLEKEQ